MHSDREWGYRAWSEVDGERRRTLRSDALSLVGIPLLLAFGILGVFAIREAREARAAIERLEARGERAEQALAELHQALLPSIGAVSTGRTMPHKYGVAHVTPRKLQLERGGCWAFTAGGLLEHSYRKQGVANGWLRADDYLRLSEQAFGVAVLDACRTLPTACIFDGDEIATGNSTEGGEVPVLYYLRALRLTSALPWSVCPYTPSAGNDRLCPGLEVARETSPLRFDVLSMRTLYDRTDIKAALWETGRALALSTPMANVEYRVPCTPATAPILRCDPHDAARCVACPAGEAPFTGLGCCFLTERPMNNLRGEFFGVAPQYVRHSPLRLEGGHAMLLVGYSDTYATSDGYRGGFIVRNSW